MNVGGKPTLAHRIAYMVFHGGIPDGMSVLHRCDNPSCVNPEHLFLGTQVDNVSDMHNKGRARKRVLFGSDHGNSKLDEDKVRQIRASSASDSKIAQQYGVSRATVHAIRNWQTWKHVT
jgi:hypothetical protein